MTILRILHFYLNMCRSTIDPTSVLELIFMRHMSLFDNLHPFMRLLMVIFNIFDVTFDLTLTGN